MKNVTKNFDARRKVFELGSKFYGQKGIEIFPQRSNVRAVAEIVSGISSLKFNFGINAVKVPELSMPLEKSDLFIGTAVGFALTIQKEDEIGLMPLMSHPVQAGNHLPSILKGFSNGYAYAIYNGKLGMKTGSAINYSRIPMTDFLYVPEVQPQAIVNAAGDALASNGVIPAFNIENVMVQLEEQIMLSGVKNQEFTIEFPSKNAIDFGIPAGYKAYAMLIFDGYLYESGLSENYKKEGNPYLAAF